MHIVRLTITIILLFPTFCYGQPSPSQEDNKEATLDSLLSCMARAIHATRNMFQEKVYLHFDNTGYYMGEKIWFKAYVVRADDRRPTPLSRVLHVELVNPGGEVVQRRKLKIDGKGQARGDLSLDSLYGTGFYEVRAFTRYMTNWGGEACFSRVFPVFQRPKAEGRYEPRIDERNYRHRLPDTREEDTLHTERLNVAFYPEGGDLVEGLPGRVAFLAGDREGMHVAARGEVVDGGGRKVCTVSSDSLGRGLFALPQAHKGLKLCLPDGRGRMREFDLPIPVTEGCTLEAGLLDGDSVTFSVRATEGYRGRLLAYAVMNYGRVWTCDTFTVGTGFRKAFPRASMPEGVGQFTVFDGGGRILCERLFFLRPEPEAGDTIALATQDPRPVPCGKVRIDVRTRPGACFSFSAMDRATLCNGKTGQVKTWMLLSSEVRGYIRNPEYYFEADDAEHRRAADLLMLTQGWRRYDWEELSGRRARTGIQPVEDTLQVFGKLQATSKSLPVGGIPIRAYLYNKGSHLDGKAMTDSTGGYAFAVPDIAGEWNLQLKAGVEKRKNRYVIGVDRRFSPPSRNLSPYECRQIAEPRANLRFAEPEEEWEEDTIALLPLSKRLHKLPTVNVKAKRRFTDGARAAWQSERSGQRWADLFYDCDEETDRILDGGEETPEFLDWLEEKNPFVKSISGAYIFDPEMKTTNIDNRIRLLLKHIQYKGREVVWILNNEYFWCHLDEDLDSIGRTSIKFSIEPFPIFLDEVKSVYITENPSAYISFRPYTPFIEEVVTIFVYTHWGVPQRNMEKGVRRTHFQGYNVPSTFEMEDYSLIPPMEDFRRTLYWNPDVTADEEGKAVIEFYNNSSCREIYVSAEGITTDGRCIFNE